MNDVNMYGLLHILEHLIAFQIFTASIFSNNIYINVSFSFLHAVIYSKGSNFPISNSFIFIVCKIIIGVMMISTI